LTVSKQALYTQERVAHWNRIATADRSWTAGKAYHSRLVEFFRFLIPEGSQVLEVGCGSGGLLAALKPSRGVRVDFSPEMIALARQNHPGMVI
jgi:ubiquinone/menaquinone biosynthesis C-methylase UbiE